MLGSCGAQAEEDPGSDIRRKQAESSFPTTPAASLAPCLFVSKTQPAGPNDEKGSVILIAFVIKLVVF